MISDTAAVCEAVEKAEFLTEVSTTRRPTLGATDVAKFCAATAFKLARARLKARFTDDNRDVDRYEQELGKFSQCDLAGWKTCVEEYVRLQLGRGKIPYRTHRVDDNFVIDDRLPSDAKIVLVSDWGTGQDQAKRLLRKIKTEEDPDVVIHLGDIYYSGTEREVRQYFYAIWQDILGIPEVPWGEKLADLTTRPATFTLSGNHDMYAGGKPYYTLIDMLGQPASYFCLRNDHWQFAALDTGFNDANPLDVRSSTSLSDTEVDWLKDRIAQSDGRKTVLLSHHQLFSAYEKIAGEPVNQALLAQVKDVLAQVTAWFWGHEHDLVIYEPFESGGNVLGRCLGHGAIPISIDNRLSEAAAVPLEDVKLDRYESSNMFQHGYVTLHLMDSQAKVAYYQYDTDADRLSELHSETL